MVYNADMTKSTDTLSGRLEAWFLVPRKVLKRRGEVEDWVDEPMTLEGFLVSERMTEQEFRSALEGDEGLRRSFEFARMASKDVAVRAGLSGEWAGAAWNYYMTNEHGYRSKSEAVVEHREALSAEDVKILEGVGIRVLGGGE